MKALHDRCSAMRSPTYLRRLRSICPIVTLRLADGWEHLALTPSGRCPEWSAAAPLHSTIRHDFSRLPGPNLADRRADQSVKGTAFILIDLSMNSFLSYFVTAHGFS